MTAAKELRKKSFTSCEKEIKCLEILMLKASENGDLHLYVKEISSAAIQMLKENGYTIKKSIVEEHKEEWRIEW